MGQIAYRALEHIAKEGNICAIERDLEATGFEGNRKPELGRTYYVNKSA
jgi:hypothetical protein